MLAIVDYTTVNAYYKFLFFFWNFSLKNIFFKKFKFQLTFFFKRFKKTFSKNFSFFKQLDYSEIENNLLLKRKFGLLKHKYNQKSFLLYKLNSYLDLKKNKNKKKNKNFLNILKKKNTGKLFYKKNRKCILQNMTFNVNRQFKKSKIFYSLFNKKKDPDFNRFNTVIYTLLSFRLFLNFKDAYKYIKEIGVWHNNCLVKSPFKILLVNDVLSLNADFYFYFYLQFMYKHLKRYFKKVKPRIFKLIRGKIDINKQSSLTYPKWVLKFSSFRDIKPFNFEYDLSIFTFLVVLDYKYYNSIHFNNNLMLSMYMYRLYNWKYIT